jgi:transcriptional regulator of heat shock response
MSTGPGGLDKRKAYILATVVYEYILTAEPVASQTLTQKYNLGISSATVRNELAELEAEGYLVQPHTSAGRIPSDSGYRKYVDQLMQPENLSVDDRKRIRNELRDASRELDDLIEGTTRLLSRLSKNLAFVTKPAAEAQHFRMTSSGAQNLLDQPEFHDLRKLRSILRIVEEQKTLYDLVADAMSAEAPSVKIGHELGVEEMTDLSIVTVPYRFGRHAIGMLSILGPRRMPYGRLMALASGTADTLSERLSDFEVT